MYTYDLENDLRYKQGIEKGSEKEHQAFVKSLVLSSDFDNSKIANLVGVSEGFVANVRKELSGK